MKSEKIYRILARYISSSIIILCSLLIACGDHPLFDMLSEDQLKVIVKCTYESNDPRGWISTYPSDDGIEDTNSTSSMLYNSTTYGIDSDAAPTEFMLDIAGMEVKGNGEENYFAPYRKTYSAAIGDETADLFDGTGVTYENDDVKPGHEWTKLYVYIRKMIFDGAKDYIVNSVLNRADGTYAEDLALRNTWSFKENAETYFHEKTVNGYNFNLAQVLTYYDYLKENYLDINRIFPLKVRIEDGFTLDSDDPETVVEVRLVVKNFIKKYEFEDEDDDDTQFLRHFYALSDWLRDIIWDEANPTKYTAGRMGGNLIGVARSYVPGKTATITGTATTGRYVMAFRSGSHTISEYSITDTERTRPSIDQPKQPRAPLLPDSPTGTDVNNYIEALLDYYLNYEVYKDDYDAFIPYVDDETYATDWDTYNTRINEFKIPALVTWTGTGTTFELTNVPVGYTYEVYESATATGENVLPSAWQNLEGGGSVVTVDLTDESLAGTTVTIP